MRHMISITAIGDTVEAAQEAIVVAADRLAEGRAINDDGELTEWDETSWFTIASRVLPRLRP